MRVPQGGKKISGEAPRRKKKGKGSKRFQNFCRSKTVRGKLPLGQKKGEGRSSNVLGRREKTRMTTHPHPTKNELIMWTVCPKRNEKWGCLSSQREKAKEKGNTRKIEI